MGRKWNLPNPNGFKSSLVTLFLVIFVMDLICVQVECGPARKEPSSSSKSSSSSASVRTRSRKTPKNPTLSTVRKSQPVDVKTISSSELFTSKENGTGLLVEPEERFQDPFCPTSSALAPCKCSVSVLECRGARVTRENIERAVKSLRKFNGLRPHQWLSLAEFRLLNTKLTTLDLTPFIRTKVDTVKISGNQHLLEIYGPETVQAIENSTASAAAVKFKFPTPSKFSTRSNANSNANSNTNANGNGKSNFNITSQLSDVFITRPGLKNKVRGRIQITKLDLSNNALTDEGLTDVFKYLSGAKLKSLNLAANRLEGSLAQGVAKKGTVHIDTSVSASTEAESDEEDDDSEGEFLPGLSKMTQLRYLNLSLNSIHRLADGPFRRNNRLTTLALENDGLEELGRNAFLFEELEDLDSDESDAKKRAGTLTIYLNFNALSDDDVHSESGLSELERPTRLYLHGNQFEGISARHFEGYLTKDEYSTIDLRGNPLKCNKKVKWLAKQGNKVKSRVKNYNCVNDPGKTLFNTEALRRTNSKKKSGGKIRAYLLDI